MPAIERMLRRCAEPLVLRRLPSHHVHERASKCLDVVGIRSTGYANLGLPIALRVDLRASRTATQ